jgi:hypothetical protein
MNSSYALALRVARSKVRQVARRLCDEQLHRPASSGNANTDWQKQAKDGDDICGGYGTSSRYEKACQRPLQLDL